MLNVHEAYKKYNDGDTFWGISTVSRYLDVRNDEKVAYPVKMEGGLIDKSEEYDRPHWLPCSNRANRANSHLLFFDTEMEATVAKMLEIKNLHLSESKIVPTAYLEKIEKFFNSPEFLDFLKKHPEDFVRMYEEITR